MHLYEEYGVECPMHLEGMFAFAIYDQKNNSLFLARDRIGEKPLYYFKDQNGIYFSSEIKPLLKLAPYTQDFKTVFN